jgi:RNA-directed DNA polymerase
VVLHPTEAGVKKAKAVLETWLTDIGLELKPSKTRITHTLREYQGTVGFDFLGWTVRQFPVGKTHTGKAGHYGPPPGFKTLIKPSQEAVKRHLAELAQMIHTHRHATQGHLIRALNATIGGWTRYHRTVVAGKTFGHCEYVLFLQLQQWARYRHPNKSKRWVAHKYWHVDDGHGWTFTDRQVTLRAHPQTHIQRHVKVKGTASPYDGNLLYWSQRLSRHYLLSGTKGRLLHKQAGVCRWCGLHFTDEDLIEVDQIIPRSEGGGEELNNKWALHRHCREQRHARRVESTSDKGHVIEEPCDGKPSCTVLKPSEGGDPFA